MVPSLLQCGQHPAKALAMAACGWVPLSAPLQIGATSGCVARHGMKQTRPSFGEFSRIVRLRPLRSKRVGSSFGQMASGRGGFAAAAATSTSPARETAERQSEAAEMVQEFYAAINRREIASIGDLFADDCVYEDLVFPKPFVGRRAIMEFFQKFMDSVGPELKFKVDDITTGDPDAAGVIWHLEWRGKSFPFSKGCSFYRCKVFDGKRQIVYGRDAVEPATKPGNLTLVALKGLAALLRRFPSLANRF